MSGFMRQVEEIEVRPFLTRQDYELMVDYFHKGDDLRWAQPDFNDEGWASMDLTPPAGSYDPFLGSSGFLPGWTVLGAAGYSGYAWNRLKVNVD